MDEFRKINCEFCGKLCFGLMEYSNHRAKYHNITPQETYNELILKGASVPTCACGCGDEVKFLSINKGYREFKVGHSSKIKNNWGHNPEAIKKSHKTQRKMYQSGDLVVWNKGLTMDDDRVRDNVEKMLANPDRGNNISKSLSGVKKSDEHKRKLSDVSKLRWDNEGEREKQSHRRMLYIIKNGFEVKSKLEDVFEEILNSEFNLIKDIDYYTQFYVRDIKGLFDFKLKGKNILIEIDGDYWHCNPNSKYSEPKYDAQKSNLIKDNIKNEWCINNNYKLFRFWESDINNDYDNVVLRVKEILNHE